jgi:hypothetical protein
MDNKKLETSGALPGAAMKAKAVLNQLTRIFHYKDRHTYMRFYRRYVRPHLEFAPPAWSSWQQGDRETLERVQEKAV